MYVYRSGLIGEVIHSRIENRKHGVKTTESFGETLRSMMSETGGKKKALSVKEAADSGSTAPRAISGDSLMYAVRNAGTDTTAASVLNLLGISSSTENSLKTAADALSSEIKKFTDISASEDEAAIKTSLSSIADRYNSLLTLLNTSYTNSGVIYSNLLKMTVRTSSEKLADAGITADEKGMLVFTPENYKTADLSSFLSGTASAASTLSSYSSAIKSQSITSILGSDEDDDSSVISSYYNALAGFYD